MTKRYEFKYDLESRSLSGILEAITFHPAAFRKAFPDRIVNNYYLDTNDLQLFYQNVNGINKRRKFRVRWYNEAINAEHVTLEIKNKENELGWKEHFKLDAQVLQLQKKLMHEIHALNVIPMDLKPSLFNRYKRSYFISADNKFRITVDREQAFARPYLMGEMRGPLIKRKNQVVELKFDEKDFELSEQITQALPFLRTKNSKYSHGVICLYNK